MNFYWESLFEIIETESWDEDISVAQKFVMDSCFLFFKELKRTTGDMPTVEPIFEELGFRVLESLTDSGLYPDQGPNMF